MTDITDKRCFKLINWFIRLTQNDFSSMDIKFVNSIAHLRVDGMIQAADGVEALVCSCHHGLSVYVEQK